jgi:hypothetical protein
MMMICTTHLPLLHADAGQQEGVGSEMPVLCLQQPLQTTSMSRNTQIGTARTECEHSMQRSQHLDPVLVLLTERTWSVTTVESYFD